MKDITIILDRSGSMSQLRSFVIEHFNDFIKEYKATGEKSYFNLVQFDHEVEKTIDNIPVEKVKPLKKSDFQPRGTTSLNDAVGMTIQEKLESFNKKTKVIIAIITDGKENSSVEYSLNEVKKLVNHARAKGWKILFFGAKQDAVREGSRLGIKERTSFDIQFSSIGLKRSMRIISEEIQNDLEE